MFLCRNCCLYIVIQKIAPQAKSGKYFQIWFFPRFGGKNGGVLSMRMQVILDSLFARPGSAPIWGGKKGEFRDWATRMLVLFLNDMILCFAFKKRAVGDRAKDKRIMILTSIKLNNHKIVIFSMLIGLKNSYFPVIHLPSCYLKFSKPITRMITDRIRLHSVLLPLLIEMLEA